VLATIREYTRKLAKALNVVGLMNIQFAMQRGKVYVIEVNPRASRTVPYVSKATGVPLREDCGAADDRTQAEGVFAGEHRAGKDLDTGSHFYVKSPVFPWNKFPGVDTVLGPEMRSTGEVMGVADNFGEAFAKAQLAAGQALPTQGHGLHQRERPRQAARGGVARKFVDMGFKNGGYARNGRGLEVRGHAPSACTR
jgi:carbamoyl-phosphate synthase large subunit